MVAAWWLDSDSCGCSTLRPCVSTKLGSQAKHSAASSFALQVRYQDGSSVLVFDMGAEITEEVGFVDVFVELIGLG